MLVQYNEVITLLVARRVGLSYGSSQSGVQSLELASTSEHQGPNHFTARSLIRPACGNVKVEEVLAEKHQKRGPGGCDSGNSLRRDFEF